MLRSFVHELLEHRANDARVSKEKVLSALHEWTEYTTEKEQDTEALRQHYMETHQLPRSQAQNTMAEFAQQKGQLMQTWRATKQHGDLIAWLTPTLDMSIVRAKNDPVYTMYENPKYL